jgi:hypothetical protein
MIFIRKQCSIRALIEFDLPRTLEVVLVRYSVAKEKVAMAGELVHGQLLGIF